MTIHRMQRYALVLVFNAAFGCAIATAQSTQAGSVQGVRLSSLCANCVVVDYVKREERKGHASGVGAVGGALAGGVIGKSVTDSSAGAVGGAVLGGLAGNAIEKRVKEHEVWATHVVLRDGTRRRFDSESKPVWRAGQVIELDRDGRPQTRR